MIFVKITIHLWRRLDMAEYRECDFLETADSGTLKLIARTRELTREYYFSDYEDTEKRRPF